MGRLLVVLGTAGSDPYAGMAWMHMQFAAGLQRLGHQVHYLEATSTWPYDPEQRTRVDDGHYAAAHVARLCRAFGLDQHWALRRSFGDGAWVGPDAPKAERLLAEADAVFNISGATSLHEQGLEARRVVLVGTDPVVYELAVAQGRELWLLDEHDDVVTYGENIGRNGCRVPPLPRLRGRMRQPVLLDRWRWGGAVNGRYTTVGNYRQDGRDIEFEGERYTWSKHHEYRRLLHLPSCASVRLELATNVAGLGSDDRLLLTSRGWRLVDASEFSLDPWAYRDYVCRSRAEFTVAKDLNVRLRSGWFSERSACYLAAGRPVVAQDTGFGEVLPVGEGLFAFSTAEQALEAIDRIEADYARHSAAARAIAEEWFRAETVLERLLEDLGL
jgi:hypothetical protein